jgi:hypothetical protein
MYVLPSDKCSSSAIVHTRMYHFQLVEIFIPNQFKFDERKKIKFLLKGQNQRIL